MASLNCRPVRCEKALRENAASMGASIWRVNGSCDAKVSSATRCEGARRSAPSQGSGVLGETLLLAPCRPVAWLTRAVRIARRSARLVVRPGRLGLGAGRAGGLIPAPSIPRGAPAALGSAGRDTALAARRGVEGAGLAPAGGWVRGGARG